MRRKEIEMAEKKFKRYDPSILYGPQIVGEKVRELLKGKYEMIPTGSYEMVNGKAMWKYGMETCSECGACQYVCSVGAIDWSYPEAGTGIVLKWS
jgi:ferredoxin-like protein FixX